MLVLQALHHLSDREGAEAVTFDLRWRPRSVCRSPRGRSTDHVDVLAAPVGGQRAAEPHLRRGQAGGGADRGAARARPPALDSTVLDDAVATQDTVTQLIGAIRRVRREVPGAVELDDADLCGSNMTEHVPSRANRWCRFHTVWHGPNSAGRSRHATPARYR